MNDCLVPSDSMRYSATICVLRANTTFPQPVADKSTVRLGTDALAGEPEETNER